MSAVVVRMMTMVIKYISTKLLLPLLFPLLLLAVHLVLLLH